MSELVEFLLARIAEEEAWIERGRALGGGAVLWEDETIERAKAECEAKRAIVKQCRDADRPEYHSDIEMADFAELARDTLCSLAAVYADHPDYDEAWRPRP